MIGYHPQAAEEAHNIFYQARPGPGQEPAQFSCDKRFDDGTCLMGSARAQPQCSEKLFAMPPNQRLLPGVWGKGPQLDDYFDMPILLPKC